MDNLEEDESLNSSNLKVFRKEEGGEEEGEELHEADNENNNSIESDLDIPRTIEDGWEFNRKHIFILSSSGKPIYSRYGDEQDLVTTFGLLQAIVSIVQDAGDELKCIKAGRRRIVYFIRKSLYFVSVSSTGEPEAILSKQLEFMYTQILLVLTSKMHDVLRNNSSKDLRDLLGSDTTRLLSASCQTDLTPNCIAFEAVRGFSMDKALRDDISLQLKNCVEKSGAALGLLMFEDSLLSYCMNSSTQLQLHVSDVLLLTHFVGNSFPSHAHGQNWVPICLPAFNANAFLQAYICNMKLMCSNKSAIDISLVLIATSSDASIFLNLHENRAELQKTLTLKSNAIVERLLAAGGSQDATLCKHLNPAMCIHFFYKVRPSAERGLPAQCACTPFDFPIDCQESRNRIMNQYQRLGVCMRMGNSSPECTLLSSSSDLMGDVNSNSNAMSMSSAPSSDHALAYSVLGSGHVVVGLSTFDSELYATFPGTISALEACGMANLLSKSLKLDSSTIFNI